MGEIDHADWFRTMNQIMIKIGEKTDLSDHLGQTAANAIGNNKGRLNQDELHNSLSGLITDLANSTFDVVYARIRGERATSHNLRRIKLEIHARVGDSTALFNELETAFDIALRDPRMNASTEVAGTWTKEEQRATLLYITHCFTDAAFEEAWDLIPFNERSQTGLFSDKNT